MKRNVAGQSISGTVLDASTGAHFAGAVTCYVTGDNGTQAIGTVGSGICTDEGNGEFSYNPSQAETNYEYVVFSFVGSGAVTAGVKVYTSFPQTGDTYGRLGAPVGSSISDDVSTNLEAILTRLASSVYGTDVCATGVTVTDGTILSGGYDETCTINQEYLKIQETGRFKIDFIINVHIKKS